LTEMELLNRSKTPGGLPQLLIYSNLEVDAGISDIKLTCMEAEKLDIPRILVNPVNVSLAAKNCTNSKVKVGAALSYPVGTFPAEIKGYEIEDAIQNGADEIYMLMALGVFLDGFYDDIQKEMEVLVEKAGKLPTYYMIETSAVYKDHLARICLMAKLSGLDFIVSSTNFKPGGYLPATIEEVKYMAECEETGPAVVAHGDFKTRRQVEDYLNAGASRVCTPHAAKLLG